MAASSTSDVTSSTSDVTTSTSALVLGWREAVSLPEWGISGIKAKVDTGARTSSLHVEDIREASGGLVRFRVVPRQGDTNLLEVTAKIKRISRVRPSSGELENRYVVQTTMVVGPLERPIEISLVSRAGMLCRMLVGRHALPDRVVVDPHRRYLHGRPLVGKKKTKKSR